MLPKRWAHIAAAIDADAGEATLYVDGVFAGRATIPSDLSAAGINSTAQLGPVHVGGAGDFEGLVHAVAVRPGASDAFEVKVRRCRLTPG